MKDIKAQLLQLLNQSAWTEEEKQWLLEYLENTTAYELESLLKQQFEEEDRQLQLLDSGTSQKILHHIHEKIGIKKQPKLTAIHRMWIVRLTAAASIIGLLFLGAYVGLNKGKKNDIAATEAKRKSNNKDILPGRDKAVLTLADGSKINLDDAHNGVLTKQGQTKVLKVNGKLAYNSTESGIKEVLYNTLSTPRGGQYQIELPDGSKVWLNAASSLRFPTVFTGKERRVAITGEAYFEVTKNKAMPFIVSVNDAEVEVLGTHFNVMAYNDEDVVKTTLLEGAVKFTEGNNKSVLHPGQQSLLAKNGQLKVISGVNVDEVMAWKNGTFHFEGADIGTVTRQLSRWYDVDIIYKQKIDDLFYAEIPRNTKLSDALKALELTGKVRFKMEGKKIIVMS